MFKKALAAAVLTAAASMAAPAAALTLTFRIDVTSAEGVAGFSPTSFTETWQLTPTFTAPTIPAEPSGAYIFRLTGAATVTDSVYTNDLKALSGVGATPNYSNATFSNRLVYDFMAHTLNFQATQGEFQQGFGYNDLVSDGGTPGDIFDDVYASGSYSRYLFVGVGNTSPSSMNDQDFVDFLIAHPLSWREAASVSLGTLFEAPSDYTSVAYNGTATLISSAGARTDGPGTGQGGPPAVGGVPEPATWAHHYHRHVLN